MGLTIFDASENDGTNSQPLYGRLALDRFGSMHSGEDSLEFEDAEPHPPAERLRDAVVLLGQEGTAPHPVDGEDAEPHPSAEHLRNAVVLLGQEGAAPHPGDGETAEPHPSAERLRNAVVPLGQEDTESNPVDDGHPLQETSEEGGGDFVQPSFERRSVVHGMTIIRGLKADRCEREKMI